MKYIILINKNQLVDVKAGELKVGMIIEIKTNERIPADLLLLYTSYINLFYFI